MKSQRKEKKMYPDRRRRVFVGLSGGVDSSVSAALLKEQGYGVTGVFMRVWNPASEQGSTLDRENGRTLFGLCQAADDRLDAMRVCATLGISFRELNLEKEYKREVVDYMIREYRAGRTPNPDVFCNRFIKFGGFYKWARAQGADYIATGHYAQVKPLTFNRLPLTDSSSVKSQKSKVKSVGLFAGADPQKDQSYFLWQIRREQLSHLLFPVGEMKKPEVRKLAKKFGLITADKKDSQGLCFVGKVDMKEFLYHYIKPKRGKVVNEAGAVIAEHNGAAFYTIGERFGFSKRLNLKSGKRFNLFGTRPVYVIAKNMKQNTLTVSPRAQSGKLPHARTEIVIKDCNWISGAPMVGKRYSARVRYRQPLQKCMVEPITGFASVSRNARSRQFRVRFESAQNAAPGQSLVLYEGEILLGGGIIE